MYIIYNKSTNYLVRGWVKSFRTEQGAKAYLTRLVNGGLKREDYAIVDETEFHNRIERQEVKRNLMTGGCFYSACEYSFVL